MSGDSNLSGEDYVVSDVGGAGEADLRAQERVGTHSAAVSDLTILSIFVPRDASFTLARSMQYWLALRHRFPVPPCRTERSCASGRNRPWQSQPSQPMTTCLSSTLSLLAEPANHAGGRAKSLCLSAPINHDMDEQDSVVANLNALHQPRRKGQGGCSSNRG